jgi:DNA-binding CsgD family transcriptional regulator
MIRGDNTGALENFLTAGRELEPYGSSVNPALAPWRTLAAASAVLLGDEPRAVELIDEELKLAKVFQLPVPLAMALRTRAMLPHDVAGVIEDLEQAAAILADADSPLEHATTLHLLGGTYRRAGQRQQARRPLRLALDIANRTDAILLEQLIRAELYAVGARPRRASLTGRTALTPRELRIAKLAANGCTNRQIAETLFLTQNTVAWHLKHVFRKLGIDTRADLERGLQ